MSPRLRRHARRLGLASLLAAGALTAPPLAAQQLPALGRSTASDDDSTAVAQNPANVGFLPAPELRWSSVYLDEHANAAWQGHAFSLGTPFPFVPLAAGLRLDLVDPPGSGVHSLTPGGTPVKDSDNYQVLTAALALHSDTSSLGVSWARTYFADPALHALSSWTFALSDRPFDALGLAFVARDVNGPRSEGGGRIGPSLDFAAALRPLGTRAFELGLETAYHTDPDLWVPRATLGVDVPFGRVRGDFSVVDPTRTAPLAWQASLGVELTANSPRGSTSVEVGSIAGRALGPEARFKAQRNLHVEVAMRGSREPVGPETPSSALRIRIETTPTTRGHVALLRELWSIADREESVVAVVLEPRTAPGSSFADVEELRDAVTHLRQRGKRVLCHLEDATGLDLYLCSAADRILINPSGGIRFAGLRTQSTYLAGLLDKLGVHAEFVRIGDHKSAPEQLTRTGATETARADKIDLLQQYELELVTAVSHGRKLSVEQVRARIATGPFVAEEAKAAGLVDGYAFDDQLGEQVSKLIGKKTALLDDERARRNPRHFGNAQRIAIVHIDGNIIDGRSRTIPLLGTKLCGSYTIAEALKAVREDGRIGAVVLRVDSGGGSAMASDVMWREVQITARQKPVIVSMGGAAASGGYYVAAPGTRIFANPSTLTGSIGIFYGKADIAELLAKIGVSIETYKTAPRADAESIYRPFTDDERKELVHKVAQFYDTFLRRVAQGRKRTKAEIDAVGQGRVWTGRQAASRGLVDEIGGLRQALAAAREAAGLDSDSPIVELPAPDTTLLGQILGIEGVNSEPAITLPPQLYDILRSLAPFAIYPGDKPLALMELVQVAP